MFSLRRVRYLVLLFLLYVTFCSIAGIVVADAALHPPRRPLTQDDETAMRQAASALDADLADASMATPDGITLRAWDIRPHRANGDAVLLLHGVADNRLGMARYAEFLVAHGFTVLMPDARAHGASGGEIATYGLVERADVRQWVEYLSAHEHPRCIFGLGESMGAAQLLQSLGVGAQFCAVAAESPFAKFREIAYDRMGQPFHLGPWVGRTVLRPLVEIAFLRARWKFKVNMEQASPEEAVNETQIPVLLIHGQVDSNIPVRHSRRIHARDPASVLWEVPNAEHCSAIATAPREFEQRLLAWFAQPSR